MAAGRGRCRAAGARLTREGFPTWAAGAIFRALKTLQPTTESTKTMTNRMIRPVEIYLNTPPPDPTVPRAVRLSQVTFADLAEPQSQNVAGTLFGGVLLGFIDRAAAFCAMKHAGRPVVTKSFDEVEFNEPIYIGELVIAHASVNFTGNTSMEIGVRVMAQNPITGAERHTNTCYATFVALDEGGRPARVPPVLPETDEEKRRQADGQRRREERLVRRRTRRERHAAG